MSDEAPEIPIEVAEPLPGDELYLVSGREVSAWRGGKTVKLTGTERERVPRWVVARASRPTDGRK